jgi:hypothetical protein
MLPRFRGCHNHFPTWREARLLALTRVPEQTPVIACSDAAASLLTSRLGVSRMTVRRQMERLGMSAWSAETWESISAPLTLKECWQDIARNLQQSGYQPEAVRKKVQRWRNSGLTPVEARQHLRTKYVSGVCSSCGEATVAGAQSRGEFYCIECWAEKEEAGL